MNSFTSKNIRNVGLFSHAGSGKTTLSEALLFNAGLLSRRGKVEEGNTVSDWQPEEIKRGISIDLSILPWEWKGCKVNLIDTPGYADFVGNVLGAIRAVDSAVVLLCATSGVEVGTEKVWEYISRESLPVIFFINRMDREGANFDEAVEELQEKINPRATPLFIPVGKESDFRGVIDLLHFRALYFGKEGKVEEGEIPEEMKEVAQRARENLVENIAETNDDLLDLYLEGQEISPSQLEEALRVAIRERHIFPILCGSGVENKGVDILADFLVDFAPSPLERPPVRGINPLTEEEEERKCDENEPFSALVFKIISDPYVGKLALFRVFSGKISSDSRLYNASRGVEEKVGQLLFLRGKNQESAKEIKAGDIGVVAKIDEVYIGDTLADREHPIVFPPISYPEPTYMAAIRPLGKGDEEKISQALSRLMEEDPTFRLYRPGYQRRHRLWNGRYPPGRFNGKDEEKIWSGSFSYYSPGSL